MADGSGALPALAVAAGAALGAPTRYLVTHLVNERWGESARWGTLAVNVIGSFVLGLCAAAGLAGAWWALVGIGFCGALTTFSTLALEIWEPTQERRGGQALAVVVTSLALGLPAAWLGWWLGG